MAQLAGQNWPMSARDVLARNLTALMDKYPELGSQKLLFKTTGVTTSTVGRIRRADVSATIDNIESLAKAFKVTASQMLDPRLPETLASGPSLDARAKASALAEEIQTGSLSDKQLEILSRTLEALRSQ